MRFLLMFLLAFFSFFSNAFSKEKEVIRITGSASVYPVVSYIYEKSSPEVKKNFKKNPIIESVGTGAGFDAFCKQKFGDNSPDIVNASREISQKEIENCKKNGINNIAKITLGLDGITLAYLSSDKSLQGLNLTIDDLHKALSKYVVVNGQVVENKFTTWSAVRDGLPKVKIIIYGPNSNSGTFDYFKEVIQKHCASNPEIASYIQSIGKNVKDECGIFRSEIYTQLPDQDSTIARKIELQKSSIGILRFAFFDSSGKFEAVKIEGIAPTEESIFSSKYKLSRPVFIYYDPSYLSKVHGLREFLTQVVKFSYRDILKGGWQKRVSNNRKCFHFNTEKK